MKYLYLIILAKTVIWPTEVFAQEVVLSGKVINQQNTGVGDVVVYVEETNQNTVTDSLGNFSFQLRDNRQYVISASSINIDPVQTQVKVSGDTEIIIRVNVRDLELPELVVQAETDVFGIRRLRSMEDGGVYEGKKSEVISIDRLVGNKATNNARQAFSKIPSLNVWESDYAGLQLDIGGRGLSPKRTSNFNTRQNGYDISADALGYPESYYTPPLQAVQQIEIVRGAGALQYGTQFGGLVNFKMKRGNPTEKFNFESQNSYGAYQFVNSFNSIHGQIKKLNYYTYGQYKRGNGWRGNSNIEQYAAYASIDFGISEALRLKGDFTHMYYLSQQPGGLTDETFNLDPRNSNRERNWFRVNWNLASFSLEYSPNSNLNLISRSFGLNAQRTSLGLLETPDIPDPLSNRDLIDGKFSNLGNETRFTFSYESVHQQKNVLLIGTRLYSGSTNFSQFFGTDGSDANFSRVDTAFFERRKSDFEFPNFNAAIFAEKIIRLNQNLSLIPGLRYEYIDTKSEGFFTTNVKINSFNDFIERVETDTSSNQRHIFLYGLGISNKIGKKYELYANATANYRAINFTDIQIQTNTQVVDSLIKDESGYSFDLGIRRMNYSPFFLEAGLFYVWYENRIGDVIDDGLRVRTNIGSAQIFGAELFFEMDIFSILNYSTSNKLSFFINGSVNRGVYTDINDRQQAVLTSGNRLEEIPNYNLKSGLGYERGNFSMNLQGTFVGKQFSDAANTTRPFVGIYGRIPAYEVFDLSSNYKLNNNIQIEVDINNLLDRYYFTRRATAYPGPGIIPAIGRTWNITLSTSF